MREIKFRAWGGDYYKMCEVLVIAFDTKDAYVKYFGQARQDYIKEYVPLEKLELMQFTGLCDDDGQDVYENDLAIKDGKIYQIVWSEYARWGVKVVETDYVLSRNMVFPLWQYIHEGTATTNFVVIGNIYEHPHLLTGIANE